MNYAGFWRRFLALLIDSLILAIPGLVVTGASPHFATGIFAGVVLGFFYFPIFESSIMSATPGKALMGIAVMTEAGERITYKTAVIRFFSHYLSAVLLYVGYLMQPFTSKRQTLHDMISGTVVVNYKSEDINYFTAWKNEFKTVFDKL